MIAKLLLFALISASAQAQNFDVIIRIRNGRIAAMGRLTNAHAKQSIDARGMVVAPQIIRCSAPPLLSCQQHWPPLGSNLRPLFER